MVWTVDTREEVDRIPIFPASEMALSPDGRFLALMTKGGVISILDVDGKQTLGSLRQTATGEGDVDLAFSPDGTRLATTVAGGGVMIGT